MVEIGRTYLSRINYECFKYSRYVWEKYYSLNEDEEFLKEFEEFKQNNKGKRIMRKKREKFMVYGRVLHETVYFGKIQDYAESCNEKYITYNGRIISIGNHNKNVEEVVKKVNNLRYWNDCVIYEGKRYGIPSIFKNIHRENDCFGNVISIPEESYVCDRCGKNLKWNMREIRLYIRRNISIHLMSKYVTIVDGY